MSTSFEALRVDPKFFCHKLNVDSKCTLKKLKLKRSSDIHSDTIKEEVDKLKGVGAIKKVFYLKWLANIVVVKKKKGKWRVYVDFTDLNKTYPKDPFPVPKTN